MSAVEYYRDLGTLSVAAECLSATHSKTHGEMSHGNCTVCITNEKCELDVAQQISASNKTRPSQTVQCLKYRVAQKSRSLHG